MSFLSHWMDSIQILGQLSERRPTAFLLTFCVVGAFYRRRVYKLRVVFCFRRHLPMGISASVAAKSETRRHRLTVSESGRRERFIHFSWGKNGESHVNVLRLFVEVRLLVLASKFRPTKNSPCTPPAKKSVECSVAARGRKASAPRPNACNPRHYPPCIPQCNAN